MGCGGQCVMTCGAEQKQLWSVDSLDTPVQVYRRYLFPVPYSHVNRRPPPIRTYFLLGGGLLLCTTYSLLGTASFSAVSPTEASVKVVNCKTLF